MSQFLNLKFDEDSSDKLNPYANNNEEGSDESPIILYEPGEHPRNICFVIDNTRRIFFSYAYLICGEYLPEENKIILTFTTHEVIMEGAKLEILYQKIQSNSVKQIKVIDERYNVVVATDLAIVNVIQLVLK